MPWNAVRVLHNSRADLLQPVLQPITGANADEIVKECPGLFELQGSGKSKKAKVNDARHHPDLLEKVE